MKRRIPRGGGWTIALAMAILATTSTTPADEPKPGPAAAAPTIPGEIVAALQERKYAEARAGLEKLRAAAGSDDDRAYLALVAATADRLDGHRDAARDLLRDALRDFPKSVWVAKIQYDLAGLELASGDPARAEELTRAVAEPLLAEERKDQLAGIHESFARSLLKPDDPVAPPDPASARTLLEQARLIARSAAKRAALTVEIARASRLMNDHARAVAELETRLKDFPALPGRSEIRFELGEALAAAGRPQDARVAWTDLARDVEAMKAGERSPADDRARADGLAAIPATHGDPSPGDATTLSRVVSAWERFLAAAPAHPRAVRASFEIGRANVAAGRADAALAAFGQFLKGEGYRVESDEARKDLAELSMSATFLSGKLLMEQGRFDEAVAAWRGYLTKFPDGPQSADSQRAILDARLAKARDLARLERGADARAVWAEFVAENPLDPRVPEALFDSGMSLAAEKAFDQAIAAWTALAARFPDAEPSARGLFETGRLRENEQGMLVEAVETYKKIKTQPWAGQAAARIAAMEAKALTVVTPRAFRSGETPFLKISSRNLERLTFTAHKLNAESYFLKKHGFENVESLDVGLVAPDAEWTEDVPGYARLKPVEAEFALKALEVPGVYVVKVTDQKALQATTMVVATDLDAIVKTSRDQALILALDAKTGRGRPNARVLVSDGARVILDGRTGEDGVLLHDWKPPRDPNQRLTYLLVDGPLVAGSNLGVRPEIAQGLVPLAYVDTDRPAYRPGQTAMIRGVVREVSAGRLDPAAGSVYRFEVIDSAGRRVAARDATLSEYGTFRESVPIDSAAPVGDYRIRVFQPGKSEFSGSFQVRSYQLPTIDVMVEPTRTVYHRGEAVEAVVIARFQYGAPAAGRAVETTLPDGRVVRGKTDGEGKFRVSFPTADFAETQRLAIAAALPEDGADAVANVTLAAEGFGIRVETGRDVYLSGETFAVRAVTTDALGEPTSQELVASLVKILDDHGRAVERETEKKPLKTDAEGRGSVEFRAEDDRGGRFVVRLSGTDRFGNAIVADRSLFVSGKDDETTLRLIADRTTFKAGETARVNLHGRGRSGPALVTWDADRILSYRVVTLKEGDNEIAWEVDSAQAPNFTLSAARVWRDRLDDARLDLTIERDLRVTVAPVKPRVGPGELVEIDVTTTDQLGRPVAAELSLAVVDEALLKRFGDSRPDIGRFFHDRKRTGAFSVSSTNTFRYAPATIPVPTAIVEDAERRAALLADAQSAGAARRQLGELAAAAPGQPGQNAPAAAPGQPGQNPPPPAPEGMMGGMGGRGEIMGRAEAAPARKRSRGRDADDKSKEEQADSPAEEKASGGESSRERFVETAYWNPAVVTGADGKARVTFPAPANPSEYRVTARGITAADTLAGQTTSAIHVRRDFFVELRTPPSLTQGDRPRFVARVHHPGAEGSVTLKLASGEGRDRVQPRTIEAKGNGVEEVIFDPIEVGAGSLALTLSATLGGHSDSIATTIPVRPWGARAFASASGSSADDATVFVKLPDGRSYENPAMRIVVSPSLERMLVEIAMGAEARPARDDRSGVLGCFPPPSTADLAADLLAATSALTHLRKTNPTNPGDAGRLTGRIQGLVSRLTSSQREDGGWGWMIAAPDRPENNKQVAGSDRLTTASALWALADADALGLLPDPSVREHAAAWLLSAWAGTSDRDARAAILHALAAAGKAGFEAANGLNRERANLSSAALAHLTLTFGRLDRKDLAGEVLAVLGPKARTEIPAPGRTPRLFWESAGQSAGSRSTVETTALATLAFARIRPGSDESARGAAWLEAHRFGPGWNPPKARGPAVAALAAVRGGTADVGAPPRPRITVNDRELAGNAAADAAGFVEIDVPADALKAEGPNRVAFAFDGRAELHYSVVLTGFARDFGPDQNRDGRPAFIERRVYWPAPPELDGKALPVGFSAAVNPSAFENVATGTRLGGRARVGLTVWRNITPQTPEWERDFLVVEEPLPAGTTLVEGSVVSSAASHSLVDGVLTFYFPPDRNPGSIQYDVFGAIPGKYRTLPATARSIDEPGRFHVGSPGDFTVRTADEPDPDVQRPTPDELLARGKTLFDAGRLAEADAPLESLFKDWTLRDDVAADAARMRLLVHVADGDARKIVRDFEIVKERLPDLFLSFDQLRAIGRAYRAIDEPERAMIVWRGLIEAGYVEDARVGELLRQRGEPLQAAAHLVDLWRRYPDAPSIAADFFGLSQVVADVAARGIDDPATRRAMAAAGVARSDLLLHSARMIQTFLARSPANPAADEASLALLGTMMELEDYEGVAKAAARFAETYPESRFLDGFQFSRALADFHLGRHDEAVALAEKIAAATYKDAAGAEVPSPNKWQALFILGQIHDARGMPAKAIEYYRQVADRFTDAADAVNHYTRKSLKIDEVTVVRPPADPNAKIAARVVLTHRNVPEIDVTVHPVDLMRVYLLRRNLDAIAGVDLAGITPLHEQSVKLGTGEDYRDQTREIELPLNRDGAYLVMIRGGDIHASGVVLVSPLEVEVMEEAGPGRARVMVRDVRAGTPASRVQVKVVASADPAFHSGETDLRGVYSAEGLRGAATVVVRRGASEYAFHRGSTFLGQPPSPTPEPAADRDARAKDESQSLDSNLRSLNRSNNLKQLERLQNRYQAAPAQTPGAAAGEFR